MDTTKYLKILKKQKDDLDYISADIKNNSITLNETIDEAEKLLLDLGYKLPLKNEKSFEREKITLNLREWSEIENDSNHIKDDITFKDLLTEKEMDRVFSKIKFLENEYEDMSKVECDKYDYLIAGISGVLTGLIDVLLVGAPGEEIISKWTDSKTEDIVKIIAKKSGWNEEKAKEKGSNTVKSAIGFLEKKFKVNYDHQYGKKINDHFKMNTRNHHLKSLAHSPSLIGLIFSLINQFTGTSTFVDNGKLVTINEEFELEGNNIISKLYCGVTNWFMHIISDMAGSSGAKGKGSGVPIPFYELFQWLNVGKIGQYQKTIADISVLVFEQGYDLRHGAAMSIPVLINELLVRFLWALKLYFKENKSTKEILSLRKNRTLKRMLFSAHGCFCLVDLGDAFIRNVANPEPVTKLVGILTRMNLIAWIRFGQLGLDEVKILLTKENEKQKYINQKLDEQWLLFIDDMSKNYEFV